MAGGEGSIDARQSYGAPSYGGGGGYGGDVKFVYADDDYGGGSAGLLALLPLVLAGGLAAGFFALNDNDGVVVSNIININGTSVTNTFMPTNTATATNTNNDMDTITNTNMNMNTNMNTVGMKRKRRNAHYRHLRTGALSRSVVFFDKCVFRIIKCC